MNSHRFFTWPWLQWWVWPDRCQGQSVRTAYTVFKDVFSVEDVGSGGKSWGNIGDTIPAGEGRRLMLATSEYSKLPVQDPSDPAPPWPPLPACPFLLSPLVLHLSSLPLRLISRCQIQLCQCVECEFGHSSGTPACHPLSSIEAVILGPSAPWIDERRNQG